MTLTLEDPDVYRCCVLSMRDPEFKRLAMLGLLCDYCHAIYKWR